MKNIKFEIEISRSNITLAKFFSTITAIKTARENKEGREFFRELGFAI